MVVPSLNKAALLKPHSGQDVIGLSSAQVTGTLKPSLKAEEPFVQGECRCGVGWLGSCASNPELPFHSLVLGRSSK